MSVLDDRFPTRVSVTALGQRGVQVATAQTYLSSKARPQSYVLNNAPSVSLTSQRNLVSSYPRGVEFIRFSDSNGLRSRGVLVDIFYSIRASDRQTDGYGYGPAIASSGINIKTLADGDDLIYPNGRGQSDFWSSVGWETIFVDRGLVWVDVGNGNDVVVGGYGIDLIGSRDANVLNGLYYNPLGYPDSTATGSKFYVGGSEKDVLDGGNDADYLIGDRFNEFELYLPEAILDKNVPDAFAIHRQAIRSYQPTSWTERNPSARFGNAAKGGDRLGVEKLSGTFSGSNYPLWIPGNDVIHGYGGDDLIYGDDNAEDNLAFLDNLRKFAGNRSSINWDTLRLGDDFLDGGSGNDQIFAGFGSDAIIGGPGSDFISSGDQIIYNDYKPLWGPKVIWGDDYNPNLDQGRVYSPDIYCIGDVYSTQGEIESSTSGIVDTSQLRKTMAEEVRKFADAWKDAKKVVKLIPKVGSVLSGLGDVFFAYANSFDKKVPSSTKPAKPLDAMTIVKDFDPTDQLVMRLAPGESLDQVLKTDLFTINDFGYSKINPLVSGDLGGKGKMIVYSKSASEQYERVFLQGYTGDLYKLKEQTDPATGSLLVYFGGSDYAGISLA